MRNKDEKESTITLKLEDFIPYVGSLLYQRRNWRDSIEKGYFGPTPRYEYYTTAIPLIIKDVLTIVLALKGLEYVFS